MKKKSLEDFLVVNLGTKFNDNNEWTLGRRVIEIENMADQMVCQQCGTLFHIRDTISKKLYGLASLFTLLCSSCNTTRKTTSGNQLQSYNRYVNQVQERVTKHTITTHL